MRDRLLVLGVLAACGSSSAPAPARPEPAAPAGPSASEVAADRARQEQAERDRIVAAHRVAEAEQQDALAATCADPKAAPPPRCLPGCYTTEPADTRAGEKLHGATEVEHLVCQRGDGGGYAIIDELAAGKLHARAYPRRFPAGHKKGTWQAEVEAWARESSPQKPPKSDAFVVTGAWRDLTHPLTHEALHCAPLAHYTTTLHGKLDACAGTGRIACEAAGDPVSHALNTIHFRVAEARALDAKQDTAGCAKAALEALAVSRGLPRWRQYKKLNVREWTEGLAYRTRFDGTLDEDAAFAAAAALGAEAERLYTDCARIQGVKTQTAAEQSFHGCW